MTRGKVCEHDDLQRGFGRSDPRLWIWCTGCQAEVKIDTDGVWRQKPDEVVKAPVAEKANMPGPIVMEFLAWIRAQELWGCSLAYADETICAEFFAQRIEAKREPTPLDMTGRCGRVYGDRHCTRGIGHAGPCWFELTVTEKIVDEVNLEVARERNALLEVVQQKFRGLSARIEALEKTVKILDERTAYQSKCDANTANAIQTLHKRIVAIENFVKAEPEEAMARRNARPVRRIIEQDAPVIVCLCGSTRFSKAFADALLSETLAGKIVLTVGSMTHSDAELKISDEQKKALDALHLHKISMADEVLVLNVVACKFCKRPSATTGTGFPCDHRDWGSWVASSDPVPPHTQHVFEPYIGESTRNEIRHALARGKPIRFLNPQGPQSLTRVSEDDAPARTREGTMQMLGLA